MYLYFDESIRERGGFIVGALVISSDNLSIRVANAWKEMGLDPSKIEYKSSERKSENALSSVQREVIASLLHHSKLALVICPVEDRGALGVHLSSLIEQLLSRRLVSTPIELKIDQGISLPSMHQHNLTNMSINFALNCDSRAEPGLQVADHAAHVLGSMLLEEMGLLTKSFFLGEESGYLDDVDAGIGWLLWADIRHVLIGEFEEVETTNALEHYTKMDGTGLFIAPKCSPSLVEHARARFSCIWLGCLH